MTSLHGSGRIDIMTSEFDRSDVSLLPIVKKRGTSVKTFAGGIKEINWSFKILGHDIALECNFRKLLKSMQLNEPIVN